MSALWGRAGFVFWGGFIGAVVLCAIVIRWRRQPFLRIADGAAVGIAAGYAIGRTGCWAVGDDYGRVVERLARRGVPAGAAAHDGAGHESSSTTPTCPPRCRRTRW